MMKRFLSVLFAISLLGALLYGCSSSSSDAPRVGTAHPDGWILVHQNDYKADQESCKACHGNNYEGSGSAPACNSCHLGSAPNFSVHPDGWGVVITDHQKFAETTSWTRCANAACHGEKLQGGSAGNGGATGPTCMISCHPGGPPAPHTLPYTDPNNHGKEAKGLTDPNEDMFYCRNCHGLPPNNFDGGFVAAPDILPTPNPNGACSQVSCHPDAKAHYTNWQGTNDGPSDPGNIDPTYASTHQGVSAVTRDRACALCHKVTAVGVGPMPGAPSCFSTEHTNANGITTGCHANGPGVAPHATDGSYRDPANHGPDAKTNLGLNFCKGCHARQLADGTYRFDVPKGVSLAAGCEDCHVANAAHPPAPGVLPNDAQEKWTFHRNLTDPRRTHFAAANPQVNCTLCHGADLTGGPVAPTCYSCHDPATALPAMSLQCTFCHGTPPDGSADLTGSSTPTDHTTSKAGGAISVTGPHNQCATCHGARDDGTGKLTALNSNYQLLVKDPTSAFFQGGDHLDGQIKMNGPAVSGTGAGYDATTVGCTKACHANDGPHQLPNNSGLTLAYGDFGGGSGQSGCTACHAYPPDGTPNANPAVPYTPVSHLFNDNGAALLANHNECLTCHGTKDDGTGNHAPAANYNPQVDHSDGQINININLQYDPGSGGCNAACHGNDGNHQFPNSTGMTIAEVDFGTASCASCHEDPSNLSAPQVAANGPHVSLFKCEDCHPGGTRGALHAKSGDTDVVIVPNNATVGISYPASHESGIHLGGDQTKNFNGAQATEAEICWSCHPGFMISEWGTNQNPATGDLIYDYGSLNQSNWVGATWSSAQNGTGGKADFSYKNGLIQSTHSANAAAGQTGMDNVADIRCSYCHDVHDLNKAPGDTVTGFPFLRGNWRGNPYKEDGAPQQGMTFLNLQRFGAVPRGNTAQGTMGGFWIDQNTTAADTPTGRSWTATDFGGLCDLCHGSGDGQWTGAEIDAINEAGNAANAWVGTNGHGNSVLGGGGSQATNIFDLRGGNRGNSKDPAMAFQGANRPGLNGAGFRDSGAGSPGFQPRTNPSNQGKAYNNYEWGATVDGTTTDSHFHKFSCSKCHNPHAARLPRLMITNCLDTKQNTWAWDYQLATGSTVGPNNTNRRISNWTSAQNCHRRVGVHPSDPNTNTVKGYEGTGADGDRGGLGWNYVTPFIPGGGQENPNIP